MAEWRETTWGAEISLEYGKGIRGYADAVGPYRVFGSNGPVGWTSEPLAPGPGIILGRKGAYRGVQFSKEPFFVIDTAYYVVPKSELDMRWLYYAIIHHKLGEIDDGSPIPSTTRAAVYVRELSVPRLEEQEATASVLGSLDDKIELNRQMNETLEAMARAIFKDWFVDFGPTRAKMEGRAPYLSPDIWSLFPDRLDDEGKPEGWECKVVASVYQVSIGRTPPRKEQQHFVSNGRGRKWLSIRDMADIQTFAFDTSEELTTEAIERYRVPIVQKDTALLSFKLTVGRVAIAAEPMCTNEAIANLVPITGCGLGPYFTYSFLESYDYSQVGSTSSIATAFNSNSVRNMKVTCHETNAAKAYEDLVTPIFSRIRSNCLENEALAATRDFLLPKLMSGEVRVKDANSIVERIT